MRERQEARARNAALIAISRASSTPPSLRDEKSANTYKRCARPGGCAYTTLTAHCLMCSVPLPKYSPTPTTVVWRDTYGTLYPVSLLFCLSLVIVWLTHRGPSLFPKLFFFFLNSFDNEHTVCVRGCGEDSIRDRDRDKTGK